MPRVALVPVEIDELLARIEPVTDDCLAVHRLGEHAIGLVKAARELSDPELLQLAEQIALLAGKRIARHLVGH